MFEIACFVEDRAHREVIGPLIRRLAVEHAITVQIDWRSAVRGHGRVVQEFERYLRDLEREGGIPDLIIVATDANCVGVNNRIKELGSPVASAPVVLAVPDPHIERWLLLDGAAFRAVFGRGCDAPDQKCSRDLYKQRLLEAIRDAGITPLLGGIEYAEDIIANMNIDRAARADRSLSRFVDDIRQIFQQRQT